MEQQLIDAVVMQLGCEPDELASTMTDIASHGADAGFSGFIYHGETCKFARENMAEIYRHAKNEAVEELGIGPLEMIAGFNCLHGVSAVTVGKIMCDGYGSIDDATRDAETSILNALAWYALEEAAQYWEIYEAAA